MVNEQEMKQFDDLEKAKEKTKEKTKEKMSYRVSSAEMEQFDTAWEL